MSLLPSINWGTPIATPRTWLEKLDAKYPGEVFA